MVSTSYMISHQVGIDMNFSQYSAWAMRETIDRMISMQWSRAQKTRIIMTGKVIKSTSQQKVIFKNIFFTEHLRMTASVSMYEYM